MYERPSQFGLLIFLADPVLRRLTVYVRVAQFERNYTDRRKENGEKRADAIKQYTLIWGRTFGVNWKNTASLVTSELQPRIHLRVSDRCSIGMIYSFTSGKAKRRRGRERC